MGDVEVIKIDFGSVMCGCKSTESVKFKNASKTPQKYVIRTIDSIQKNIGYEKVKIHPTEVLLPPEKSVTFTLTYLSYLENVTDNVAFNIHRSDELVARLNVRAQTVGPKITCVPHNVNFFCFYNYFEIVKNVELCNATKCEAKFCFDLSEDNQLIEVSQMRGVIPAGSKTNLKLTFKPKQYGIYYRKIFCLIQYHKPVVLNILGIFKRKIHINPKNLSFNYPPNPSPDNTYEDFFEKLKEDNVPEERTTFLHICTQEYDVSLKNSINTLAEIDSERRKKSTPHQQSTGKEIVLKKFFVDVENLSEIHKATTLVNLSKNRQYFYVWDHDHKNNFQLEPCRGVIKPGNRIEFSVYFTPSLSDQLYYAEIDLQVFLCDDNSEPSEESIQLPLTMTLKIIGHSFPRDSNRWIPQCNAVLKCVGLPSCKPNAISYATLMIERRGHLPVTFVTSLPENSSYTVQPRLGYISGNFQIILIRFNGKSEPGMYEENLKIIYNSNSNFECVRLKTLVEVPELIFGHDNSFKFECTFPGSKTEAVMTVENPTNLYLSYQFILSEDITWFDILDLKGQVEPMSSSQLRAIFKPKVPCEHLDYVQCNINSVPDSQEFEVQYLQLIGSSQYGFLVATPSMYDFGECIYGREKTLKIHIFNFSSALLHFKLYASHRSFPVGVVEEDVKINPTRGSVAGKCSVEIEIRIVPHAIDIFQYALLCQNLENNSEDAPACEEAKNIFSFRFEGVLPTIQIIDLLIENGGPLFSSHWIWKMMSINRLNKNLNSLTPEEIIELRFPEAMVNSSPINITLLIEANRFGKVSWNIEKEVICSCFASSKSSKQSSGFLRNDCCHSRAITITPIKATLPAKGRLPMQLTLTYESRDESSIRWILHLPFNRRIILRTLLASLPNDQFSFASMYLNPTLNLRPIFIGDLDPPLQLFWLYNNTSNKTSYVVDKVDLGENTTCIYPIFDCLNPTGEIPPFSLLPLAFIFRPIELMSYSAEFSLCIRKDEVNPIFLESDGVASVQQIREFFFDKTIPEKSILKNDNISLECSVNIINIPYIRIYSDAKRIFFLQNTSNTNAWAFRWHLFHIENIIKAKVKPVEGIIQPGQRVMMTLKIKSLCYSTFLTFSLPCDIIDYSALMKYETALRSKTVLEEQAKDYFTITEKGITFDVPNICIPEKPNTSHLFLTVNTNIISTVNIDQKLLLQQQVILKSSKSTYKVTNALPSEIKVALPSIRIVLEKVLWNILNSELFKFKITSTQGSLDYNYLQIVPEKARPKPEIVDEMFSAYNKNQIQDFAEDVLKNIIFKNLCLKNNYQT